jgi:hypothetical protein
LPEYWVWRGILARCTRPGSSGFKDYGGRGIEVCESWRGPLGFVNFMSDMGRRPVGKNITVERLENNGPYHPSNCKWKTQKENNRNKGDNRPITINNETKIAVVWAESVGLKHNTFTTRIDRGGMSPGDALTAAKLNQRSITIDGITRTRVEWARISGLSKGTILSRLRRGWSEKAAVFGPLQPGRRPAGVKPP